MGLPLVGLLALMLVVHPRFMLTLLLIFRPSWDLIMNLTKVSIGGQEITIGAGVNLAIISLAIFLAFYERNFPRWNKVMVCWIIFLLIMLAATVYSPFQGRAIRLFVNYVSYFAMYLIPFIMIKSKEDFLYWLKILAVSFVIPVLYGNFDLMMGGRNYADAGMRIKSTFTFPTIFGFYLVLGFTAYFYILKSRILALKPKTILLMKLLMFNMLVLLVATKTRNAWVAGIFGFLIYGFLKDKKVLMVLLLLIPLSFLSPQVRERTFSVVKNEKVNNYEGMNSFEWRLNMWKSSVPLILKKPLEGYGLTSFFPMSASFSNVGTNGAHNVYLETLFETGIFGLLSFIALFMAPLMFFFESMLRSRTAIEGQLWALVLSYVIGYMMICFADNLSYYLVFNWYVWFFIGLMMVASKYMTPVKTASQPAEN